MTGRVPNRSSRSMERAPTHPGAVLREIVFPELPVSKSEIARSIGISRQTLHDILGERKPITPTVAIRLSVYLRSDPETWLRMQLTHDLWHARQKVDVSDIEPVALAS